MNALLGWLDHRTGFRDLLHEALYERIPGGARWRYVWGSTLVYAFVCQAITGIFLWAAYSPSAQTAWESVFHIQYTMTGGWFLRGLHHYMAQLMIVLLAVHLMQVVIDGAYRAPREVNFWLGLILLKIVLGLSLTGYLLPWDQKGYWATKVATNLMLLVPGAGEYIQRLAVGGPDYGHHTLTRFFALHTGVLPAALVAFLGLHIWVFRKHGITVPAHIDTRKEVKFWPDQVLKDAVACLAVLLTVVGLTIYFHGAELSAPADPSNSYSAARPEWYFLFLFQFLKYFPGSMEPWGAIYLPGLAFGYLVLMPLIGRWTWGHRLNIVVLFGLIAGAGFLTYQAINEDANNEDFRFAVKDNHREAETIIEQIKHKGIGREGALGVMDQSPEIQGPRLFAQRCAGCHRFHGHDGRGKIANAEKSPQTAPDLGGFASREWVAGLLDPAKIATAHYFGGTKKIASKSDGTGMVEFVKTTVAGYTAEQKQQLSQAILALSAEAKLPYQKAADEQDAKAIADGLSFLQGKTGELGCADCHKIRDAGDLGLAPDLTGYGSEEWLSAMIYDPTHQRFYPESNENMPLFGATEQLDEQQIRLIVQWLRMQKSETPPAAGSAAPVPAAH